MADVQKELKRLAREVREELRERGDHGEFDEREWREIVHARGLTRGLDAGSYDATVTKACLDVDHEETTRRPPRDSQLRFAFHNLEGDFIIDEHRRVPRRRALKRHAMAVLLIKRKNVVAVEQAFIDDEEGFLALEPYWEESMTMEEAVLAYLADHPEG